MNVLPREAINRWNEVVQLAEQVTQNADPMTELHCEHCGTTYCLVCGWDGTGVKTPVGESRYGV